MDLGEDSNGNVLEKHGLAAGLRTKGNPCYRVGTPPAFGRGRNGQFRQRQAANCWSPFSGGPSGLMVSAPIPGASLRARVSSPSRTRRSLRSVTRATLSATDTLTSPRLQQPVGVGASTSDALAQGVQCRWTGDVRGESVGGRE